MTNSAARRLRCFLFTAINFNCTADESGCSFAAGIVNILPEPLICHIHLAQAP